jgi:hypothetical protein
MVWYSYHRARIKEKQSQKNNFPTQDLIFCSHEELTKQLDLVAKGILKLNDPQRKAIGG